MQSNNRQIFLNSFLRLFGVDKIELKDVSLQKITGTAIYDDEGRQDFCWNIAEDKVPSDDLIELIKIIYKKRDSQIDKIKETSDELFLKTGWTDREKFNEVFAELFKVEVKMIDDGEETDSFFIHD